MQEKPVAKVPSYMQQPPPQPPQQQPSYADQVMESVSDALGEVVDASTAHGMPSVEVPAQDYEQGYAEGAVGGADANGGWQQLWDDEVESYYYYHESTGEATWVRPEEYTTDETQAAVGPSKQGNGEETEGEWEHYWDETEGMWYSYNAETGETKWDEVEATEGEGDTAANAETDAKIDALFAVAEPKW